MEENNINELEMPNIIPDSSILNDIYDNPKPKITIEVIQNE